MAKKPLTVTSPLNIGTIGHVDHGKTLTAAITKCYLMQVTVKTNHLIKLIMLQKKKKEVYTINTSHVEYETANRHYR
jgi:elongation factor Tu